MDKFQRLTLFIEETISYLEKKLQGIDRDRYFADRDIRSILDWQNIVTVRHKIPDIKAFVEKAEGFFSREDEKPTGEGVAPAD